MSYGSTLLVYKQKCTTYDESSQRRQTSVVAIVNKFRRRSRSSVQYPDDMESRQFCTRASLCRTPSNPRHPDELGSMLVKSSTKVVWKQNNCFVWDTCEENWQTNNRMEHLNHWHHVEYPHHDHAATRASPTPQLVAICNLAKRRSNQC